MFDKQRSALDKPASFALFIGNFASLIEQGFQPAQAVRLISEARSNSRRDIYAESVDTVVENLKEGKPLAESFEAAQFYPDAFISMVRSGEASGRLAESLRSYGRYVSTFLAMQKTFKGTMRYPMILLSVIAVAVILMTGILVPTVFEPMLAKRKRTVGSLPLYSQFLFLLSYVFGVAGNIGAVVIAIGAVVLIWGPAKKQIEKLILLIPSMRELTKKLSWATWMRLVSMCLMSGMRLTETLEVCSASRPSDLEDQYDDLQEAVENGHSVGKFLSGTETDPLLVMSVDLGEQSGKLPDMMLTVSDQYMFGMEQEIKSASESMQPIVIAVLAVAGGGLSGIIYLTQLSLM